MSTGDWEVPRGCESLHPRLLWERGARVMQSPGAPVRPGWVGGQGVLFWVWGGTQPGSFLLQPGGVGPALVCSGLFVSPLTSLPWHRYVVESPRMPLSVSLKPPFLRPELLEQAVPLKVKLSGNGLKAGRSKVGVWTGTKRMRVGLWGVWVGTGRGRGTRQVSRATG